MARPSGVATFLFTDVEGSTRRWEDEPDVMRVAVTQHDETLRMAIERNGGWLFKHTGDRVVAVFDAPRSAVKAAVEASGIRRRGLRRDDGGEDEDARNESGGGRKAEDKHQQAS